jgi:hypothetical protein
MGTDKPEEKAEPPVSFFQNPLDPGAEGERGRGECGDVESNGHKGE